MRYDALVIGAGLSGLAAGIRLGMYGKQVLLLERHALWGGLNSFYRLRGRRHDVGLHALTNATSARTGVLSRVLRQLRVPREALQLGPQHRSVIRFPDLALWFSNDPALLESELAAAFPARRDALAALAADVASWAPEARPVPFASARAELMRRLGDERLVDVLLLPTCYYGSPLENDIDWTQFRILYQSLFLEGIARPRGGIRTLLDALKTRLQACGTELRTNCGVERILLDGSRAIGVRLDDGSELLADHVLSSAGLDETLALCGRRPEPDPARSDLSFLESIHALDCTPAELGLDAAVAFYCLSDRLCYAQSEAPTEPRCGVLSCPGNYADQEPEAAVLVRQTVIANPQRWRELVARGDDAYRAAKLEHSARAAAAAASLFPDWRAHTCDLDVFTPRTIEHYTGHVNGRVYGSPEKRHDGDIGVEGLRLIGTDQGYLGIVGAMMSGIGIANRHVLATAAGSAP
jgi:phytoene dehydrogenase-like protein